MDSGMPKLWVLYKALHLRREKPEWFGSEAAYVPLSAEGPKQAHLIAFSRGDSVAVLAPRWNVKLGSGFGSTTVELPQGKWTNIFTGETVNGGSMRVQQLFRRFPVALLVRDGGKRCISLESGLHLRGTCRSNPAALSMRMQGPDDRGWWHCQVENAGPGTDYGYLLDDDPKCYPDPRSEWQPNGVHGLSRIYDQAAFEWSDARFQAPPLASAIIYELHIGTFTPEGTFDAAAGKLAYLAELGVTHVELMPVAAFEGRHGWGYDGVALFAVHEPYGGPDGLKRFVNAAHQAGLAVLLDVVYNHFGPSGNYTGKFGPYIIPSHHTPWGGAVNLEDAEFRRSAPVLLRQRADVAARLSYRWIAHRRGARVRRSLCHSLSGAAGD